MHTPRSRHVTDRGIRGQASFVDANAIEVGLTWLRADAAPRGVVAFGRGPYQALANRGIAQSDFLLIERQRAHRLPFGQYVEGQLGLERQQYRDTATVRLADHASTARGR